MKTKSVDGIILELKDAIKREITAELFAALAVKQTSKKFGHPIKRKRKMSKEARAKIAAAQRARWAKQKGK